MVWSSLTSFCAMIKLLLFWVKNFNFIHILFIPIKKITSCFVIVFVSMTNKVVD
ncbi:hypothetical protein ACE6H2_023701 [Prunus campanulata]